MMLPDCENRILITREAESRNHESDGIAINRGQKKKEGLATDEYRGWGNKKPKNTTGK